jgi:spermidine synthase
MDGRLFLKTSNSKFDVIIINLPDPFTAQLNRFYTQEFFTEAAEKLNPGGVLSFQVTSSENYISQELADLLRCLEKTLRVVFPRVVAIPGETVHFLAANQPGSLTLDPSELMTRLRERHIRTQYVREYYIPFRMSPDRMLDLQLQIEPQPTTPINRDFTPIAYYFDVVLWSSRFHSHWRDLLESLARLRFGAVAGGVAIGLLGLALLAALYERSRIARHRGSGDFTSPQDGDPADAGSPQDGGVKPPLHRYHATLGLCVAAMGFTLLGLEVLLLLGFQALYGYVYQQLSILVAVFMVGMAVGAWLALNKVRALPAQFKTVPASLDPTMSAETRRAWQFEFLRLALLQLLAALSPLLLYALFVLLEGVRSLAALLTISQVVFPVLALTAGLMGGFQFPLASRIYLARSDNSNRNPGMLYALDLLGACLGAVALSAYLLPVYGFLRTAMLMALLNLAATALTALASWEVRLCPSKGPLDWLAHRRPGRKT